MRQSAESATITGLRPKHNPTSRATAALPGRYRNNQSVSPKRIRTVHYKRIAFLGNNVVLGMTDGDALRRRGVLLIGILMGKIPEQLRQIIAANIRACRMKKFPGRGGGQKCAEAFGFPAAVVAVGARHEDAR